MVDAIDQAAEELAFEDYNCDECGEYFKKGFKAGVAWRDEQVKELIKNHHKAWSHEDGTCSPECVYLCKAILIGGKSE